LRGDNKQVPKKIIKIRMRFFKWVFDIKKCIYSAFFDMTSKTSQQSQPIEIGKQSDNTGLDIPLSPTEPGKFDFYR